MKKFILIGLTALLPLAAAMPALADTSSEKTETRKALLADSQDVEARIRLGVIIAGDIADSKNMDIAAEAESALRLLDDQIISTIDDEELANLAREGKAAIYAKLLIPDRAEEYSTQITSVPEISFGRDIEMPYYIDLGLSIADPSNITMPFIGVGLTKSAFSSMVAANAGIKYFRENLNLEAGWVHGITPDFCSFDYDLLESYARSSAAYSFKGNVLKLEVEAGRKLYAEDSENFADLETVAFTDFGLDETIELELLLYNDGLNKISGEFSAGMTQVPSSGHYSFEIEAAVPFSFDFIWCEAGFLPRFYHTGSLPFNSDSAAAVNIGKRHYIYENAVNMADKAPESSYYRYYETSAAVDAVIRFFTFPLAAPADRFYLAVNGSGGFGIDSLSGGTDFLYALGISAGFDYEDNIPFEIRFGIDQDGYIFTYMTVVNRISHSF